MIPQHRNRDGLDAGPPQRRLYPVDEAAELLGGITERSVWNLVATNKILSVHVGRRRMIPAEAIESYVQSLIAAAQSDAADTPELASAA